MKYLLGVLLGVSLASALPTPPKSESPSPCETPKQFVGDYGTYMRSPNGTFRQNGVFYYDRNNERQRVDLAINGKNYKIVQEYKKKVQYLMFTLGGRNMCVRQFMKWPYMPLDMPPKAVELEHGRIGTKEHGLGIRRFYADYGTVSILLTVTADECIWTNSITRFAEKGLIYYSLTNISRLSVTEADFAHPPDSECPFLKIPYNPSMKPTLYYAIKTSCDLFD